MITLYSKGSASPNIRKISTMLYEIDLPFTVCRVEKQADGKFADEFLAINPNATVPAIVDHDTDTMLFESGAILQYLAEKTNKLLPAAHPARGEVIKWVMFEAANVGPTVGELFHYMLLDSNEVADVHLQRYKDKLARHCAILDQQLNKGTYLVDEFSIADIALYPWTVVMEDMAEISLGDYPNLQQWADTISQRPAVQAANNQVA